MMMKKKKKKKKKKNHDALESTAAAQQQMQWSHGGRYAKNPHWSHRFYLYALFLLAKHCSQNDNQNQCKRHQTRENYC